MYKLWYFRVINREMLNENAIFYEMGRNEKWHHVYDNLVLEGPFYKY